MTARRRIECSSDARLDYACVLTRLGRFDEAVTHLTTLADLQQGSVVFLGVEPALVALRDHPGFDALLRRIGAPRPPMASAPRTAST